MQNLGLGFLLMGVGMVTVFAILLIVIYGSRLIIGIVNKVAPQEQKASAGGVAASLRASGPDSTTMAVLSAAVAQLTAGKGKITNVTKL